MKEHFLNRIRRTFFAALLAVSMAVPLGFPAVTAYAAETDGFQDVPANSLYYEDVQEITRAHLMNGVSKTEFAPELVVSRGMWVTILYRMAGQQPVPYTGVFSDVGEQDWFAPAVEWAATKEIVSEGSGTFRGDAPITRSELSLMSAKFAELYFGCSTEGDPSAYSDREQADPQAGKIMAWMAESGIMPAVGDQLLPDQSVNRGTAAGIALRLYSQGVTVLPELTEENLTSIMKQRLAATETAETTVPMLWQGLLQTDVDVNGGTRTVKFYIPENVPQGTTFVMLNVPEGEETIPFLQDSGWIEKADQEQICLLIAEPGPGGWGPLEEEQDYLQACYQAEKDGIYFRGSLGMYLVGYGDIGTGIHKLVMADPLFAAAAVFLDASSIEPEYLEQYRQATYASDSAKPVDIGYAEVPVPVWISSNEQDDWTLATVDYWKEASQVGPAQEDPRFGLVYTQTGESTFTPEGGIAKVAVDNTAYDYTVPETTDQICSFILQYQRCGAGGAGANLLSKKVDYDAIGVDFYHFTDSNGIDREYLVYVPQAYRNSDEPLPVVMSLHGQYDTMRSTFEAGLWHELADKNSFIVVVPESTLVALDGAVKAYRARWQTGNAELRDTDVEYLNELLDRVISDYSVDESRIYCTGHSMGIMLANYMAGSPVSHRFAAIGGTSSGLTVSQDAGGVEKIPFFLTMGEYDLWSTELTETSVVTEALDYWLVRDGVASRENVVDVRSFGAAETYKEGRFSYTDWKDDAGIPWVRFAVVEDKDHMNTPIENEMLWNEFFSKWRLGENGVRLYEDTATQEISDSSAKTQSVAETVVTPMEEVDITNFQINWLDPLNSLMFGMYSHELSMEDGSTRLLYQYIPTTWRYGQPEVAVAVPSGEDPILFFERTGWKDAAEKGPFAVVLISAEDWSNQDEYLTKSFKFMNDRAYVHTLKVAFYMVGYGDAANSVMKFALTNNDALAGVAAFGVDSFDKSLLSLGETPTAVSGVVKADVPMPVWIGVENKSTDSEKIIQYWKGVNEVSDQAFSNAYADEIYLYPSYQSNTFERTYENIASVYVTEGLDEVYSPEFTENLYFNFLSRVRRVYSETIRPLKWYATTEELGFDHYTFTMHDDANNVDVGREYWVYVPSRLRDTDEKAPLVLVAPGGSDSGEEFITITDWYKCAEERGFVLVHMMGSRSNDQFKASTTWTPADVEYFKAVREAVIANYNIDEGRIYLTGHSMGCMLTHYVSYLEPQLIAAGCGNDALPTYEEVMRDLNKYEGLEPNFDVTIPFMLNTGTKDQNFIPTPGKQNDYTQLEQYFQEWRTRYGLSDTEYNFKNGRNWGTEYHNDQGIPVVKLQWNEGKTHCMDADDPYSIYDFLCNYSRGEDGKSYYMGVEIQVDSKNPVGEKN